MSDATGDARSRGLDAAVVPGLLLLVARDLAWHDPPRVLGWRALHDAAFETLPLGLSALLPRPSGLVDRDPVAFALASLAVLAAAGYLLAGLLGWSEASRRRLIALAAVVLVGLPTAAFVASGFVMERPYGQDGGVVQLPLAMDELLAGRSPYAADYSESVLGRQSRASAFWERWGGNPILHHHAYLPGTHLLMLPFHVAAKWSLGAFDPRLATLLAFALAGWLAARGLPSAALRLSALACVWLNPLVYWHQVFGANDVVFVALLLATAHLARAGRRLPAAAVLGLACATKQLAWPFAPFLLLELGRSRSFGELLSPAGLRALALPALVVAAVCAVVIAPVALLDAGAFWDDIVAYNVGLPGGDAYPLGGTPGIGAANFLLYTGYVSDLRAHFSFGIFYVFLIPLGLLMARAQLREGGVGLALVLGSSALAASVYLSRVAHPNYLLPLAILLPVGVLWRAGRGADVAVVPLLLFAVAIEISEGEVFRALWDQAVAVRLPEHLSGWVAALAPRAGPEVTRDPLGLGLSALVAGLGLVVLLAGVLGAPRRVRLGLGLAAALGATLAPLAIVTAIGERTGIVRAQHEWVVGAAASASRLRGHDRVPVVREAWSTSFRLEPPRRLEDRGLAPPGAASLQLPFGRRDPRWLACLGLLALLAAGLGLARTGHRPLALALALVPSLGLGLVFGHPAALALGALLATYVAANRRRWGVAGTLAGVAIAVDAAAWWLAPFMLLPALREPSARRRAGLAALAAGALLVVPSLLLDARAGLLPRAGEGAVGVGLDGLLLYWGLENSWGRAAGALAALVVTLAGLWWARRRGVCALAAAATAAAFTLWLTPAASPDATAYPLALAVLAGLARQGPGSEVPSTE